MQTLLQDLTEFWPIMGELTSALPRTVQRELVELLPVILSVSVAFIVAAGTIFLKFAAPAAFIPMFFAALAPFLMRLRNSRSDLSTVNIEMGKLKVNWKGAGLALGFLVAGLLLLILSVSIW